MKTMLRTLPLLPALAWLAACGEPEPSSKTHPRPLTIGSTMQEISGLIWIAESQGYFKQRGLELKIKEEPSSVYGLDDAIAGATDLSAASEFVVVRKSFEQRNFKIIAAIDVTKVVKVVARQSRGVKKPADLRGRRVAVPFKSNAEFFLGQFLLYHGLALDDVQLVDLQPVPLAAALEEGEVAAACVWEPHVFQIKKKLGGDAVVWSAQGEQRSFWTLVASDKTLSERPEAIRVALQALIQAERFIHQRGDQARDIIRARLKVDEDYIDGTWDDSDFEVNLDQALLLLLEQQADWAIKNHVVDDAGKAPNYLEFIATEPLESIDPKRVGVIR